MPNSKRKRASVLSPLVFRCVVHFLIFFPGKVPTSHVALEVALETKPNLLLLTEEVASRSSSSCCCKPQNTVKRKLAEKNRKEWLQAATETQETSIAEQLDRWGCCAMMRYAHAPSCTRWMITATICGKLSAASQMTDPEFAFPKSEPLNTLRVLQGSS